MDNELLKKVRKIEIKTKSLSHQIFAGEYHSAFKGRGMAFSEVREYQFGDDVRNMDWNVTARLRSPYVKVFEEEREMTVVLLIDVSASGIFGTTTKTKRELLAEIAAVLAFSASANNDKVGDEKGELTMDTHDNANYYDAAPDDMGENIRTQIVRTISGLGFDVEASHHESAKGQHEIDFKYADALTSADNIITFRYIVKAIARENGQHATFMPKPIAGINGSGMHCNVSIFKDGKNTFYDPNRAHLLSETALYSIGGLLEHVKQFTAITNPTVNSYKRLVPGYEAPVYLAWSLANRSALIRVPLKKGNATRVELRSPDPSCNPYLAFAVILEAMMDGIEKKIKPPLDIDKNIYQMDDRERKRAKIETLPGSLYEALMLMKKSSLVKSALGEHIFKEFMQSKLKEWDGYRTAVTKYELDMYLERY